MKNKKRSYWILFVVLAIIVVGGILGCQYSESSSEDINITPLEKEGHPKLGSTLYQLTQAEDYNNFAQIHGVYVIDNKVRVIIELVGSEYNILPEFGIEETRYKNLLQVIVYIDKLLDLADDPNIKFIRVPQKPLPGEETTSTNIQGIKTNPAVYAGKTLTIEGTYQGWKAGCGGPPVSRSDWWMKDDTSCIYVTGKPAGNLDPLDNVGSLIKVTGSVKTTTDDKTYLEAQEIEILKVEN